MWVANRYSTSHKKALEVRSRFARSSLEVRSWCGTHAQIDTVPVRRGAVRCACAAVIRGRHAHRIRVLTAVENYPLLRVVGEDHLDHDQISHLGHVNTRCAKIRSQYRIAPRRLELYSTSVQGAAHVAYRAHRNARTAPHRVHVYITVEVRSTFGVNSVLIRYCFGTASVRYFFMTGTVWPFYSTGLPSKEQHTSVLTYAFNGTCRLLYSQPV